MLGQGTLDLSDEAREKMADNANLLETMINYLSPMHRQVPIGPCVEDPTTSVTVKGPASIHEETARSSCSKHLKNWKGNESDTDDGICSTNDHHDESSNLQIPKQTISSEADVGKARTGADNTTNITKSAEKFSVDAFNKWKKDRFSLIGTREEFTKPREYWEKKYCGKSRRQVSVTVDGSMANKDAGTTWLPDPVPEIIPLRQELNAGILQGNELTNDENVCSEGEKDGPGVITQHSHTADHVSDKGEEDFIQTNQAVQDAVPTGSVTRDADDDDGTDIRSEAAILDDKGESDDMIGSDQDLSDSTNGSRRQPQRQAKAASRPAYVNKIASNSVKENKSIPAAQRLTHFKKNPLWKYDTSKHSCSICGATHKSYAAYYQHQEARNGECKKLAGTKVVECDLCDKAYGSRSAMILHKRRKHGRDDETESQNVRGKKRKGEHGQAGPDRKRARV